MSRSRSRLITLRAALLLPMAVAVVLGVASLLGQRREASELAQAEREMAAGRFDVARDRLVKLAARRPNRGDIVFALGGCEASLGNVDAALDAWASVPESSPLAPRAALDRARVALEHGRLAAAEESLAAIADRRDPFGEEAARLMQRLLLFSGRSGDLPAWFERQWRLARAPSPAESARILRSHWLAETQALPVGAVGEALERYHRQAPEDDRVWLGLAELARRSGRLDEAAEWLERCEARRPDDPDVLLARLEWALASGQIEDSERVLGQIPAHRVSPIQVAEFRARIAALRDDPNAEREALERCVELKPGDASSWGRLADLAAGDSEPGRRDQLRRRKAEVDRDKDEYTRLMGEVGAGDLSRVGDLASLAESLGRRFEAIGWWTIQAIRDPGDAEAHAALGRLRSLPDAPTSEPGQSLADLIPEARGLDSSVSAGLPAGGPVVPLFRDEAETSRLQFVYENDQSPQRRLPETMGGGLGLIDYDGDGRLDLYVVQGGPFPGGSDAIDGGDRLFRNLGDGTFEDVTEATGIASFPRGFGHGVAVGDYDNDGHPDLFITRWRSYALYRNRGDGTFEDLTEEAGLGGDRGWPTSAAWADLDGDGDLDLYVCQYLRWDPERDPPCPDPDRPGQFMYCVPRRFEAEPDRVFRNDGGRFVDVSDEAGIIDRDGRGLGVVAADLDGDGLVDLFVANDMTADLLFHNLGGFRFEEVGELAGVASNAEGGYQAGMGVSCGDLDGDGQPELVVTNFYGESTSLFRNLGGGQFAYASVDSTLASSTRFVLGFGTSFLDANNDGRLDLVQTNGHVNDFRPGTPYAMPSQLFLGHGVARLADVSNDAGDCWSVDRVGRGLAVGDLDNDGRIDVLILAQAGPLAFLRNLGPDGVENLNSGHFVTLQLEGTRSNRDGVGARVLVTSSGRTQAAQRLGGGSFLSANDGRLHFGLGPGAEAPPINVEVRWPSGQIDRFDRLPSDTAYRLTEGDPSARPLKGWSTPHS